MSLYYFILKFMMVEFIKVQIRFKFEKLKKKFSLPSQKLKFDPLIIFNKFPTIKSEFETSYLICVQ